MYLFVENVFVLLKSAPTTHTHTCDLLVRQHLKSFFSQKLFSLASVRTVTGGNSCPPK